MRKVTIVPFDNKWKLKYNNEKKLLIKIFQENLINIYHIGSTSIKGLS